MSKLYVAKMVIIKPLFLYVNSAVKIKTEDVLVEKTMLGYRDALTVHNFIKWTYLKDNEDTYNSLTCPYKVCSSSVLRKLQDGQTQFLIDDHFNLRTPLREAEEQDVKTIIDNFQQSALNQYYKDQQARKERKEREKRKMKELIREAKK